MASSWSLAHSLFLEPSIQGVYKKEPGFGITTDLSLKTCPTVYYLFDLG